MAFEVIQFMGCAGYGVYNDGNLVKVCDTHAQAWKAVDRLQHEPVNKQEAISRWIEKQILD